MKNGKAQLSMEYMAVMGFVLLLTLPLTIIFFEQSTSARDQVNAQKAGQIIREITDTSEQVYYLGEPTAKTIKVSMPDNVKKISIINTEIAITIETSSGDSDVIGVSAVNLTGNLSTASGIHQIKIQAIGNGVSISNT